MQRLGLLLTICWWATAAAAQQPVLCPAAGDHYHLSLRFLDLVPDRRLPVLEHQAGQLIGLRSVAPPDLREQITSIVSGLDLRDGWLVEHVSSSDSPEEGTVQIISNRDNLAPSDLRDLVQALGCVPVRQTSSRLQATILISVHDGLYFVSAAGTLVLLERDAASGRLRFSARQLGKDGAVPGDGLVKRHLVDGQPVYVLDEHGLPCTATAPHHRRPIRCWDHLLRPDPGLPAAFVFDEYWAHANQVVFSANTAHLGVAGEWPWPDSARRCPDGRRAYTLLHPVRREPAILFTTMTLAVGEDGLEVHRVFADLELVRDEPAAPFSACGSGVSRRPGYEQDSWTLSWSLWCQLAEVLEEPAPVPVDVSDDLRAALEELAPSCHAVARWQVTGLDGGDPLAYLHAWEPVGYDDTGGEVRGGGTGS